MTREEAIKVIRKMLAYTDLSVRANLNADMVKACSLAIKALEQEPRWIPVEEKLPEIHNYSDNYLVTLKRGGVHIAMFTECDGKHWWTFDDVVAWMPLPQPYREVKE